MGGVVANGKGRMRLWWGSLRAIEKKTERLVSQLSSLFQKFALIGLNFRLKWHSYCYNTDTSLRGS